MASGGTGTAKPWVPATISLITPTAVIARTKITTKMRMIRAGFIMLLDQARLLRFSLCPPCEI